MEEGTFWYVGEKAKGRELQILRQMVGSTETVGVGNKFHRI